MQIFICFQGIGDLWTRGHNGWNGSAYHQAARNTIRWGDLFPVQYYTGRTPPTPEDYYTHHPLAMHLHNVASVFLFGDDEAAIRFVPALHGVLVVVTLMLVVRRFWGDKVALLAGAVYTLMPINAIYANMANHSSGFILWSLIAFYCYFRFLEEKDKHPTIIDSKWKKWFILLLGSTFMATLWDWPAYYVAFFIFIHLMIQGFSQWIRNRKIWGLDVKLAFVYGLAVISFFLGHILLVLSVVGHLRELSGIIASRMSVSWDRFLYTLKIVPPLMMTLPVLILSAMGIGLIIYRIIIHKFESKDIIPLSYGLGGIIHFFVFKWSTIVHEYWLWTTLPFVAIVCAKTILEIFDFIKDKVQAISFGWIKRLGLDSLTPWVVFTAFIPLVIADLDLVPRGRMVGGSMWFTEPTRPNGVDPYYSGRIELLFAKQVRLLTDRKTGVLYHESIDATVPEPRFDITLDREIVRVKTTNPDDIRGLERPGINGWVFIADARAIPLDTRIKLARVHPYLEFNQYVMVDLRWDKQDIKIFKLEPRNKTIFWWFWYSAFEPSYEIERDHDAEFRFASLVEQKGM